MPPSPSEKSIKAVRVIWDKVAQPGPDGKKQIVFAKGTEGDLERGEGNLTVTAQV